MNELIRIKYTVPLSMYESELEWEDLYEVPAPIEFQKEGGATVELEWYVKDTAAEEALKISLSKVPFLEEPEGERITSDDWQSYWKEHFHVQRIGRNVVLVPEWEIEDFKGNPDDCVLMIRPGLGFGTGDHFTTSFCLAALETYQEEGFTFADVGTGSGILAAAAVKMGYREVLAFDNDPLACSSAKDTLSLNGVEEQVELECCDLGERAPFCADLVCANLFDTTLLRFVERLTNSAAHILVLTGIRSEKAEELIQAYQAVGMNLLDQSRNKEWCGLVFSTHKGSRDLLPDPDSVESAEN